MTKKHHWTGETDPDKYYGFVYLITNTVTGRKYIGRKFYHIYKKKKRIRQSNWRVYTGSSKPLLEDIKRLGKDKFTFEIICNYKTRGGLVSGEVHFQTDNDVLSPELLPCGERLFYNGHIGAVKFITPEFHSTETRAKMSATHRLWKQKEPFSDETKHKISQSLKGKNNGMYRGPYLITFKDGHTEQWNTLSKEGYSDGHLCNVLKGNRKTHKDVVKIERISPDDE